MIVEKITRRFTKALIDFFLQTPKMHSTECPFVEVAKRISMLFGTTRYFVKNRTELNRRELVKDLDKVTDLCLKLAPNKNWRSTVRSVSFTFRDTVLLDEDSESDESEEDVVKKITDHQ